ncbi:hypothetical protein [Flavobacterium sp.]|uniref:hypothetical protein n=1 Tax=Flavobacterium sp. TaxID=239 RepID=UPI00375353DE
MKTTIKKIAKTNFNIMTTKSIQKFGIFILLGITSVGCDSSSDPITVPVVPDTFNHLYIRTQNAPINSCNVWDLTEAFGTAPAGLKRTDTYLPASLGQTTMTKQCSAYCRNIIQGAKRYVVSTGERVVVYDASSSTTPLPIEFPITNIQAMEFVNGRFFMVKNHILKEYDIFTMNPITSFTPISLLPTAGVSNMTFNGNFLYVISSSVLYKIDTTGSGLIAASYTLTTADFQGLEYVNNPNPLSACNNSLYVVRKTATANELVRINEATAVESTIAPLTYVSNSTRIASILDYNTEYYYIFSADGFGLNTFTFTTIDLTPASGVVTPNVTSPLTGYQFGYQLKD